MSFAGWDIHFFVSGYVLAHVHEPKWDPIFCQSKNSRLEEIKSPMKLIWVKQQSEFQLKLESNNNNNEFQLFILTPPFA